MLIETEFPCGYCGELNVIGVDSSAGTDQELVEDCQVCCRPNRLTIRIDSGVEPTVWIEAAPENG